MVGLCIRVLLRYCALLHTRIYHAEGLATHGTKKRTEEPRKAVAIYGTNVHGDILWSPRPGRIVRDEQNTGLVFQHPGHVRGIPTQDPRGRFQVLLPVSSGILGSAGHCPDAGNGEAAKGLQGVGSTPFRLPISDCVELSLPFHIYGNRCLHHA